MVYEDLVNLHVCLEMYNKYHTFQMGKTLPNPVCCEIHIHRGWCYINLTLLPSSIRCIKGLTTLSLHSGDDWPIPQQISKSSYSFFTDT